MKSPLRYPLLFLFLCCLYDCGPGGNRQDIDLSDHTVQSPEDGVGHYVYALNLPESVRPGEDLDVQMEWRTVGGVDPNARYTMEIRVSGPATKVYTIPSGANTVGELHLANWLNYDFAIPDDFPAGDYTLGVRLQDANRNLREVPLGFEPELRLDEGFYRLAGFTVTAE
jgi:uncharacterized protein YfaS (alpha-2-macroglobulin family)